MKALGEYFLMVVFTLLVNRVHVFANVMFHLNRETWQSEKIKKKKMQATPGAHLSSKMLSNRELDINLGTVEVECFTLVI